MLIQTAAVPNRVHETRTAKQAASGIAPPALVRHLSRDEVVSIVTAFAAVAHLELEGSPGIDIDNSPTYYYEPVWRVGYLNGMDFQVADRTGIVTQFTSSEWLEKIPRMDMGSQTTISRESAIRLARSLGTATKSSEIQSDYFLASMFQSSNGRIVWNVWSDRQADGIQFHGQRFEVYIDAITSRPLMVLLNHKSSPRQSTKVFISAEDAKLKAQAAMRIFGSVTGGLSGLNISDMVPGKLKWVQPNTSFSGMTSKVPFPSSYSRGPAKLAWVLTCDIDGYKDAFELYIDAATGSIIGAEIVATLDSKTAQPSLNTH
ncbi:MAG TPA: hypothetical protein VGK19_02460 [Capsulimonadaceae bacterium]|jgi:hypothetical protein